MSSEIFYMDTSEVHPGALEELKAATKELVDFVDANEPRIIAYSIFLRDDGTQTVLQMHPDSASLEYHMEVAGPIFRKLVKLVTLQSIHIYGEPTETVLKQLHEKAHLLGGGQVVVHGLHAGFVRFGAS